MMQKTAALEGSVDREAPFASSCGGYRRESIAARCLAFLVVRVVAKGPTALKRVSS